MQMHYNTTTRKRVMALSTSLLFLSFLCSFLYLGGRNTHLLQLLYNNLNVQCCSLLAMVRGGNWAGRVGSGSGLDGSDKFDQKNCQVMGRIRVNLIRVRSGFGSNIIGFFQISGS
jgi:hypothetical protein